MDVFDAIPLKRQKTFDPEDKTLSSLVAPLPHLISINDLSIDLVNRLLKSAGRMKELVLTEGGCDILKHKVLASVFYEPSTRTSCSFQAAMLRLGGSVICVNEKDSSAQKGESIEDTIQTMSCYCDAIVIRHPMKGSSSLAASVATKPVINAGDGVGEHPTQALLDLFTIYSELGSLTATSSLTVAMVGDLKHGRTVHSLVRLLALYPQQINIVYVSPSSLGLPDEIYQEMKLKGVSQSVASLDEAIKNADVLYVTRIQKERFATKEEYDQVAGSYVVDANLMKHAKERMIVMHPLPRVNEISRDVDKDPRAAYFRQMENGMYMRMAILELMLGPSL